jgi:hypothetical protein
MMQSREDSQGNTDPARLGGCASSYSSGFLPMHLDVRLDDYVPRCTLGRSPPEEYTSMINRALAIRSVVAAQACAAVMGILPKPAH